MRLIETIHQAIDDRDVAVACFLDIQRAFDKVWHDGLIAKLYIQNINPSLVKLISNYITGRKFQVAVGDGLSTPRALRAGVPQGSLLSPLLYNLYTADLPKGDGVSIYSYADDVALLATGRCEKMANRRLQITLNSINSYYQKWKLNRLEIPKTKIVKYLGINIDQSLNWSQHIAITAKKGNQALGMLYSLLQRDSRLSADNKLLMYKQIIRPIMTYGSLVWGTAAKCHLNRLQVVQNKCLRMAVNAPYTTNMTNLQAELGIKTIQQYIKDMTIKKLTTAETHVNRLISESLIYQPVQRFLRNRPKTALIPPPVP